MLLSFGLRFIPPGLGFPAWVTFCHFPRSREVPLLYVHHSFSLSRSTLSTYCVHESGGGKEGALSVVLGAGGVARWPARLGQVGFRCSWYLGSSCQAGQRRMGTPDSGKGVRGAWSLKGPVGVLVPEQGRRCHSGLGRGLPTALHCGLFILFYTLNVLVGFMCALLFVCVHV